MAVETYLTPKGIKFELAFVSSPEEMAGTMTPFKPSWYVQHLSDGLDYWCDTKEEAIQWANEWDEISD